MDALSIFAEVSLGLAGFAGIAVVLGRRPGQWTPGDAVRVRLLLIAAFGALFASLTPIGLAWSGASDALGVRCGAAVLLGFLAYWIRLGSRLLRELDPDSRRLFDRRIARMLRIAFSSAAVGQVLVIVGPAGPPTWTVFFLGLLCAMGYAALAFVRLVFVRPAEG